MSESAFPLQWLYLFLPSPWNMKVVWELWWLGSWTRGNWNVELEKRSLSSFLFIKDYFRVAAAAKSLQLCPTLCDPIDGSPPGSPVPEILHARTLEWVAISFSNAWKWKVKVKLLSRVRLLATPWTAAYQAPLYMGFSRQEYWSGVPLPSPILELGRLYSSLTPVVLWVSWYELNLVSFCELDKCLAFFFK